MVRPVSNALKQAVNAQETDKAFIILLTLEHEDLSAPIRVTQDSMQDLPISGGRGVISRGNEFVALPFEIVLPDENEDQSPRAKLKIDNISREIVAAVRSITSPASAMLEIVLSQDPDVVEMQLLDFQLRNVTYDAFVVEGDLTVEQFDLEPFPAGRITPSRFPGVF